MSEAVVFFIVGTIIFIVGLLFLLPILGLPGASVKYSSIYSNLTTTVVTHNGETKTVTVPKSAERGFEKLEIVNAYAEGSGTTGWIVHVTIKNTGSVTSTITKIFVDNRLYRQVSININPRQKQDITLTLTHPPYTSGQTISIVFVTKTGGQYPASITLP